MFLVRLNELKPFNIYENLFYVSNLIINVILVFRVVEGKFERKNWRNQL